MVNFSEDRYEGFYTIISTHSVVKWFTFTLLYGITQIERDYYFDNEKLKTLIVQIVEYFMTLVKFPMPEIVYINNPRLNREKIELFNSYHYITCYWDNQFYNHKNLFENFAVTCEFLLTECIFERFQYEDIFKDIFEDMETFEGIINKFFDIVNYNKSRIW